MSDAALLPVLQPPADGVQPRAVVFEILRPGDRIPGPQQMLRQCGQGPYFVLKAHMLVVGDGAALAGCSFPRQQNSSSAPSEMPHLENANGETPFPVLLLDLPGQRLVLLRCCRHLPFFQTVVEAVDLRDRLEDRVSVLRRHGIEFPDAALAVHFFGRTQIGVQLVQNGVELLYPRGRNPPRRWRTPGTQRGPPSCGSAPRAAALHPWHSRASHIAGRRDS